LGPLGLLAAVRTVSGAGAAATRAGGVVGAAVVSVAATFSIPASGAFAMLGGPSAKGVETTAALTPPSKVAASRTVGAIELAAGVAIRGVPTGRRRTL
jgi:hypothetical protein